MFVVTPRAENEVERLRVLECMSAALIMPILQSLAIRLPSGIAAALARVLDPAPGASP